MPEICEKDLQLGTEAQVYYNMYFAYNKKSDYKKALESYLIHDSLQEIIYNLIKTG